MHIELLFKAGIEPMRTVGDPGAQGALVTGTHGAGVKTPLAAVVAAMTAGLVGALHIPKGGIFLIGTKSMIVAAGFIIVLTRFSGVTTSVAGAAPKLHFIVPAKHTC